MRVVGDERVVEEHLGEALVAVEPTEAAHGDARRSSGTQQVGEALVRAPISGSVRNSPNRWVQNAPAGGPRLLAVEHPAAVDARARLAT